MEHDKKQDAHTEVDSLMEIVALINAKGDQGEIEEIGNRSENHFNPSPNSEE